MVRLIALGIGLVFCAALMWGAIQPRDAVPVDLVAKYHLAPREISFHHDGVLANFDRGQLQRGYQVYKEVCSACHSLHRVAFRNLEEIGFSPAQVKAIAKESEITTIDDKTGEPATRPALASDLIPGPYANEAAARAANNNALPPDLSLITKAREEGPRYVASLLTGYQENPPKDWAVPEGLYYNPYFHSLNIAMIPPLSDDQVTYSDGTKATRQQMANDVSAFLTWTAEPKLIDRRRTGVGAVIFLLILTGLAYLSYQRVWADLKHPKPGTQPAE